MPTLEACNAKDKLVILRSCARLSDDTFARIPSLMLAGLFIKNISAPATPFFDPSPFPVAEGDETNDRTPSPNTPNTYSLQHRPSVIDPTLVSVDSVYVRVTLKDCHSPCTSVSFDLKRHISSFKV